MTPTVNSVSNTNSANNAPQSSTTTDPSQLLGNNFNTFLTLLTTQLQNQDPLSPLDTNQFTQQLVSFSQVEQAINANSKLSQLVSMQSTNQLVSALPVVGKTIEFTGDTTTIASGGSAQFSYTLNNAAAATTLSVLDSTGSVVWRGAGETASGRHDFTWNGTGVNGASLPAGDYKLAVAA